MSRGGKVGLVDWGGGNIENVLKALRKVGAACTVVTPSDDLLRFDRLVLPGVGAYTSAMVMLAEHTPDLRAALTTRPALGICLGMQILSTRGYEGGNTQGLGLIEGDVVPMKVDAKVPHMGWAAVRRARPSRLLAGVDPSLPFYFMHGFEFINYTDVAGLSTYEGHIFVSAVERGNLFGVQFHPEKSGPQGLQVLENFLTLDERL